MRFVFRVLAVGSLSLAVLAAVADATRTIATGEWRYEPVGQSWRENVPDVLAFIRSAVEHDGLRPLWDTTVAAVLSLPGWLVFGALALGFYTIGRRRGRSGGRPAV